MSSSAAANRGATGAGSASQERAWRFLSSQEHATTPASTHRGCRRCGPRTPLAPPFPSGTAGDRRARRPPRGPARRPGAREPPRLRPPRSRLESRSHARLEEQRHLHDGRRRLRRGSIHHSLPLPHPLPHPRPQRALQPLPCLVVAEHLLRHQRPIHSAVRGHLLAESFDDQRPHLRHSKQVVHHRVRRQRPRPSSPSARSASDFPPPARRSGRRGEPLLRGCSPSGSSGAGASASGSSGRSLLLRLLNRRAQPLGALDLGAGEHVLGEPEIADSPMSPPASALAAAGSRAGRSTWPACAASTRLTLSDSRRRSSRSRGSSRARRRRARPPRAGSRRSCASSEMCTRPRRRP